MSAALQIGRVGGLATALGIGAMIVAGGSGFAWADETSPPSTPADQVTTSPNTAGAHAGRRAARNSTPTPRPVASRPTRPSPLAARVSRALDLSSPDPAGAPAAASARRLPAAAALGVTRPVQAQPTASLTSTTGGFSASATTAVFSTSATTAKAAANPLTTLLAGVGSLLFNQSPGVRSTQSSQTGNGVIAGALIALDPDSSPLTYAITTKPTHGNVVLGADGTFTYTADPAIGATGATDLFRVTVSDADTGFHLHGLGGLINFFTLGLVGDPGHTATTTVSLTVSPFTDPPIIDPPTVDPPVAGELSTFCGCTLMPANTVFHANVSTLPVLSQSATWTTLLGGTLRTTWGNTWMNNTGGMPVNTVSATRTKERVIFNRGLVTSGPSIDDRLYAIPDRPLVEGMPNVPAWDRHLLVFQEGTCISQELYNVANGVELPASDALDAIGNAIYASRYGSAWIAEAGVQVDMSSPLYPTQGWANASRLPYLPLILRPDDLTRGSIDHMLGITIAKDRGTGYAWPARAGDGTGTNPDGVPMGTVFRLKSDFDMSSFTPAAQVILRALQQHGAVVFDSMSAGQDGATLLAMSNGWTGTEYQSAQRELRTVPLSAFEAVDVLGLALDPSTGWMIST